MLRPHLFQLSQVTSVPEDYHIRRCRPFGRLIVLKIAISTSLALSTNMQVTSKQKANCILTLSISGLYFA
ncbi:hypothetical protein T06_12253 [Trichinella sp. T6]|nr:hypothetical protein T06_12253 [Trichinella sp. T6]